MRRIKASRVDDVRLGVCTSAEIKTLLESTPEETKSTRKPRPAAVALADLRLLARLTLESPPGCRNVWHSVATVSGRPTRRSCGANPGVLDRCC
jgi:hypothetical protein